MYDFTTSSTNQETNVGVDIGINNGYIWSNTQNNEYWPTSVYNKPSFSALPKQDETKLNENDSNHFSFNNYSDKSNNFIYNNAFINNQSAYNDMSLNMKQQQQQNYYGLSSAPVLNNQFNHQIHDNHIITPKIENVNDSNNSSGTISHLEHASDDSPHNNDLNEPLDKISNNNSYDSNKENNNDESNQSTSLNNNNNNIPAYFTTQKMINNTVKLSYTAYQLELLNAIYTDMKYPNSVQKTLVAKLIGITRDQVKIWFQNRRRKDTLVSQGKVVIQPTDNSNNKKRRRSDDDDDNSENNEDVFPSSPETTGKKKQVIDNNTIYSVLSELRAHQNAPSRLSSKRTKPNSNKNEPQNNDFVSIKKSESNTICPIVIAAANNNVKSTSIESFSKLGQIVNTQSSYSTASSSSSSEEENNFSTNAATSLYMPNKYQTLQQPFSIQEYIDKRCMANIYKQPKIHNPYQTNQQLYSNPVNVSNHTNKLNSWAIPPPQLTYSQQSLHLNDTYSKANYDNSNTENMYANQTKYSPAQFSYETNYQAKYPAIVPPDSFNQHVAQQNYQFLSNNLNSYNFCV